MSQDAQIPNTYETLLKLKEARKLISDVIINDLRNAWEEKIVWLSLTREAAGDLDTAISKLEKEWKLKQTQ